MTTWATVNKENKHSGLSTQLCNMATWICKHKLVKTVQNTKLQRKMLVTQRQFQTTTTTKRNTTRSTEETQMSLDLRLHNTTTQLFQSTNNAQIGQASSTQKLRQVDLILELFPDKKI